MEISVAGISEGLVTQCNCWERSTPTAGLCWWICGNWGQLRGKDTSVCLSGGGGPTDGEVLPVHSSAADAPHIIHEPLRPACFSLMDRDVCFQPWTWGTPWVFPHRSRLTDGRAAGIKSASSYQPLDGSCLGQKPGEGFITSRARVLGPWMPLGEGEPGLVQGLPTPRVVCVGWVGLLPSYTPGDLPSFPHFS